MKNFTLFVILTIFVLSACGAPAMPTSEPTLPPAPTNTLVPPPTETPVPPTATLEPSPTPVPLGGGGKIFMLVNQLLIPKEFDSSEEFSWFSASSDGSNLSQLSTEIIGYIYSISPDGKRMLAANANNPIALMNTDGTGIITLDTTPNIYVSTSLGFIGGRFTVYAKSVLWLSNGNLVFLVSEEAEAKSSIYVFNQDGNQLRKLEQPSSQIGNVASLLFVSPDDNDVYWVTGTRCLGIHICDEKYFVTKLDDSDQQQIWNEIKNASDNIYLSPSGQYLTYNAVSRSSSNGCYLATLAGETLAKIEVDGAESYCGGDNPWSPIEDKILVASWSGKGENFQNNYSVWTAPDGTIKTFSEINAVDCHSASWTPDGKSLFLAVCIERSYIMAGPLPEKSLGQRLINISDSTITEYPDLGFCYYVISPNSKWVLFYACTNDKDLVYPSQLLNLETKETFTVFGKFVTDNVDAQQSGMVFWTP